MTETLDLLQRGALALGLHLTPHQLESFRRYYNEIEEWNRNINLTAITQWDMVQTKHFLDSLTISLALTPEVARQGRVIDVASGAGFPGLPLKITYPGLHMALVEATGKKAAFLTHMVETLALNGVEVHPERSETLAHHPALRETFDVATARALAPLVTLVELTLPFCRVGGLVVAPKKGDINEEIEKALPAIELLGGRLEEPKSVSLEGLEDQRCLIIIRKVGPTPPSYPRRPGLPRKRPL